MVLVGIILAIALSGAPPSVSISQSADAFVRNELELTRYQLASVDLNEDGAPETIILSNDREYCGSGGCTLFVLVASADTYRVVTRMSVTRPPVRVLSTSSNGWRDLAVKVAGGGVRKPYEAVLRFDGRSYPANPSVVNPSPTPMGGRIIIE